MSELHTNLPSKAEAPHYTNYRSIVCPVCRDAELETLAREFIICNSCDCSYKLEKDRKGKIKSWRG